MGQVPCSILTWIAIQASCSNKVTSNCVFSSFPSLAISPLHQPIWIGFLLNCFPNTKNLLITLNLENQMYKIVDESILFFSRVSLSKILFGSSLYFMGIRVFIVGYEMECEKSFFNKTWCIGESLRDWDKSRVPITSYQTNLVCTFCPIVIQLAWLFIFLHASHVCFILASHYSQVSWESSCESPSCCTLLIKSSHSLTHNSYIIPA